MNGVLSRGAPNVRYEEAIQALNSLQSNFALVDALRKTGAGCNKQAVSQVRDWARQIGYKPSDFKRLNLVHIAGTKGKGSTSTFISSILSQYFKDSSGVGLYTSPHLRSVRERIKINNIPLSEDEFQRRFWEVWQRLALDAPSRESSAPQFDSSGNRILQKAGYFHFLTLMAFHTFMKANLDSAVIECGIGGEYDSTNIIEEPLTTGVTSLGIDHEGLLGRTIEEIAWHKAGIFKRRVPAFTVPQSKDAEAVLYSRAKERGTELNVVTEHTALKDIKLGIKGPVQRINASLAIAVAASHLSQMGHRDVPDPLDNISNLPPKFVKGLEKARLGGRCDKRSDAKVPNLTWFLDGGHTRESIELAGRWFAASRSPNALQVLIFNQQTRDARALARQLRDSLDKAMGRAHVFDIAIFCPNVTYENAGYKADLISINVSQDDVDSLRVQREMAEACKEINPETKPIVCGTIEEAVARVRKLAGRDTREVDVLVTGSLHLVGGLIEVVEAEVEREEML